MLQDGVYPTVDEVLIPLDADSEEADVSLTPSASADTAEEVARFIAPEILKKYDVYSYRHAAAILKTAYADQLSEVEDALRGFSISTLDIAMPGGNESTIPKLFSAALRPQGWLESRIQADLLVRVFEKAGNKKRGKRCETAREATVLENYIDGHKIDYVKDRVALDLEWNSKDQTFDRDLYAFRMFHECGVIGAAVLVTRSAKLNEIFEVLELLNKDGEIEYEDDGTTAKLCKQKYGASTTWMGKLLYRLNAGRHGGCPVLVFGITPAVVTDWPKGTAE